MQDRIYSRISQAGSDSPDLPSSLFHRPPFQPPYHWCSRVFIPPTSAQTQPNLDNQTCTTRRVYSTINKDFALCVRFEWLRRLTTSILVSRTIPLNRIWNAWYFSLYFPRVNSNNNIFHTLALNIKYSSRNSTFNCSLNRTARLAWEEIHYKRHDE